MATRKRKSKLMPIGEPKQFVLLAVDQAAKSGWSVFANGSRACSGTAETLVDRMDAIRFVKSVCEAAGHPLVVLLEDHSDYHFGHGRTSVATLLGLGAARGRWEELITEHLKVEAWHKATPYKWGGEVLGLRRNSKSEDRKVAAVRHAHAVTGEILDDNEAEAICMGLWGLRNIVLTKRVRVPAAEPANDVQPDVRRAGGGRRRG